MHDAVIVSIARPPTGKAYRGAFNNTKYTDMMFRLKQITQGGGGMSQIKENAHSNEVYEQVMTRKGIQSLLESADTRLEKFNEIVGLDQEDVYMESSIRIIYGGGLTQEIQ
ncbi:hypothetical protein FZZ93_03220 [Halomonas eurihalina]|uniref:Uncharacterized protein n=1 Tax=Halomonas eurihalina TaxID=42566 RepID=A0A5D9DE35_HALER|nr:hypothetical protein [Halomonas eurihalina]MDR5859253.1 hypothetical protein [Halomonas eurihalina]TZG40925.1 hypothetical protein FZZ93_03220 [Halomonas eurihalina]